MEKSGIDSRLWPKHLGSNRLDNWLLERICSCGIKPSPSSNSCNSAKSLLCPSLSSRWWGGDKNCCFYMRALTKVAADQHLHYSPQLEATNTSCSSFLLLPCKNFRSNSSTACRTVFPSSRETDDTVHWKVIKSVLELGEVTPIFPVQRNSHQQQTRCFSKGAKKMS